MVDTSFVLAVVAIFLLLLNALVHFFPKKKNQVRVAFIPPTISPPLPSIPNENDSIFSSRETPITPIQVKITQLFSRLEDVEKRVQELERSFHSNKNWLESIPVRNARKKKSVS
ncbi:MAG: hypothetical protein V1776_05265 [Candidatus Diapherotrites archaeon]